MDIYSLPLFMLIFTSLQRIIFLYLLFFCTTLFAQEKDSSLTTKEQDKLFLTPNKLVVKFTKLKKVFTTKWEQVFINFTENNVYLIGGMNFGKQNIKAAQYDAVFNYELNKYNKNVFKPGYLGGVRIDGNYKEKYPYAFAFIFNKIASGTNYQETKYLPPFIGSFSNFKAEEQFFLLSITTLYKKNIQITDTTKFKFYFVAGPNLDIRLSKQSTDNLVSNAYRALFLNATVGIEFNNQNFYSLFFHYKNGLGSITKNPIRTKLNLFEMGMMIKASDLF